MFQEMLYKCVHDVQFLILNLLVFMQSARLSLFLKNGSV